MPLPILSQVYHDGINSIPYLLPALKVLPWLAVLYAVKLFFNGTQNGNERIMHSRVAIITGGTSGIGAAVVDALAARGTQLILLVRDPSDIFTIDYISDLRERHDNQLIYAEKCDLSSLHSVRLFATKFIDNTPPRRLDMVVCCAGIMSPPGVAKREVGDTLEAGQGVEEQWAVNYLGHVHLLELLTPLLRVQPMDRDVRVLLATCPSYLVGDLDLNDLLHSKRPYPLWSPWKVYGATKLALMTYAVEAQRRHAAYKRPDGGNNQVRVYCVDPGVCRTLGTKRWLSLGSVIGLLVYVVTWPIWWLILKSPGSGSQGFLTAAMSPECGKGEGGVMIKECRKHNYRKPQITDPAFGQELLKTTLAQITDLEKRSAKLRAEEEKKAKKEGRAPKHKQQEDKDTKELIERAKKAKAAEEKNKLLEKLLKEGDLPPLAPPMEQAYPDSPARNTRSRSKTPASPASFQTTPMETPVKESTSSANTRRRSKKA